MLTKKELSEYWTREKLEHMEFVRDFLKPKHRNNLKYPKENRFKKINQPAALIGSRDIWAQIPLYGTTFINLMPWPQRQMIDELHWGTDKDIQNLISLSKDDGRVQFVLPTSPLDYEQFEHLHPILEELRPPTLMESNAVNRDDPEDKLYYDEFMNEANKFFVSEMYRLYSHVSMLYAEKRINDYATDYIILKKIGYHEIADEMLRYINHDPDIASAYFTVFGNLIAAPAANPLLPSYNAMVSYNFSDYEDDLTRLNDHHKKIVAGDLKDKTIPGEIGHFIMEKTVPLSKSYEASIALMTRFDKEDLHNLMNSIKVGYQKSDNNIVQTTKKELSETFDNIWKEAKNISKTTKGIEVGFTISLMALGAALTLPIGGIGALAALGLQVGTNYLPASANKIANFFSPNYLVTINNFKKLNNIKD